MKYHEVIKAQKKQGYFEMQELINSGTVWKMEGSMGREAMDCLRAGACMLPKVPKLDYYGNYIPARQELKSGTKGTFSNSVRFYSENF